MTKTNTHTLAITSAIPGSLYQMKRCDQCEVLYSTRAKRTEKPRDSCCYVERHHIC